jgi:hypothetical protein
MKKSEIVRNIIARAQDEGWVAEDVIAAVMNECGFKRQLARAYIKNNWNKTFQVETTEKVVEDEVEEDPVQAMLDDFNYVGSRYHY